MMQLDLPTVEQIINLVAEISDPTVDVPLPERKRQLAEGLTQMVGADVWIWSTAVVAPSLKDVMSTYLLHGGWKDEAEATCTFRALTNPSLNVAFDTLFRQVNEQRYLTVRREDWLTGSTWERVRPLWEEAGFAHSLFSYYAVEQNVVSCIGLHRRGPDPAFTERECAIVHVAFRQIDWLHRHGTNTPASGTVLRLSPRERQVLVLLLGGKSRKEIAHRLEISEHTVGDYMKSLHKHFSVNSRAELLALFLVGKG